MPENTGAPFTDDSLLDAPTVMGAFAQPRGIRAVGVVMVINRRPKQFGNGILGPDATKKNMSQPADKLNV